MICNRFTPLVVSFVLLVVGIALGAGKSETDASAANTASKILLTVGMVGIVVSLALLAIGYVRSRHTPSPPVGGGFGR
ncbi:MAG: hypothetical protein R2698_14020 [Microthrixaceae bacterium]